MEDEQIMSIALLKVKYLDSITSFQLSQLLRLFNLSQNYQNHQQMLLHLKKTILLILLIERNCFKDYLNLPKFLTLDDIIMEKLTIYFSELWSNFLKEKEAIGNSTLKDIAAIKTPLDRLNHYIAEPNIIPNKHELDHPHYERNFCFYPPPLANQTDQMNFPLDPYFMQYRNFHGSSIFNENDSKDKSNLTVKHNHQALLNVNMTHPKVNQDIHRYETIFKQEEISSNSFSQQVENQKYNQFQDVPVFKCICQQINGNQISQIPEYFPFQEKAQQYFKFLKENRSDERPCPLCTICKNHFFTKLAIKPIIFGWQTVDEQILTMRKIYLTQQQAKLYEKSLSFVELNNNYKIQLRVLRIGLKQDRNSKGFKTSFTFPLNQLRKLSARKWLEIKLKGSTQKGLIFYALVCICNKSQEELRGQLLDDISINDNYLSSWMQKNTLEEIQMNLIHPITKKIISFPVRGELCEHIECEDLDYIYHQFIEKNKQNKIQCSICRKDYTVYQKFKADGWLLEKLRGRDSQIGQLGQSSSLKYRKNGDIQWIAKSSIIQPQSNNQMIEESQLIDSQESSISQSHELPKNSFSS